jgi:hypothetical protein
MALRTSDKNASRCAGSTIDTGRLFQSGVAGKVSMPKPKERASFFTQAISPSLQGALFVDQLDELHAGARGCLEPLVERVLQHLQHDRAGDFGFGGTANWALARAAPAASDTAVFNISRRCINR